MKSPRSGASGGQNFKSKFQASPQHVFPSRGGMSLKSKVNSQRPLYTDQDSEYRSNILEQAKSKIALNDEEPSLLGLDDEHEI